MHARAHEIQHPRIAQDLQLLANLWADVHVIRMKRGGVFIESVGIRKPKLAISNLMHDAQNVERPAAFARRRLGERPDGVVIAADGLGVVPLSSLTSVDVRFRDERGTVGDGYAFRARPVEGPLLKVPFARAVWRELKAEGQGEPCLAPFFFLIGKWLSARALDALCINSFQRWPNRWVEVTG